tara:strand:- start:634 stop:882 length:249 start_codon:yes stop_codon:yes gene_type:complete
MNTLIDIRLFDLMPAQVKTINYLEGKMKTGYNQDLDVPTDCKQWLELPGDAGLDITDTLSPDDFCVEYMKDRCYIYQNMYKG